MPALRDLETVGDAETGDTLDPNPQTVGGSTDIVFTRTYKVNNSVAASYLFQILDAPVRVMDDKYTDAYLVKQRLNRIDQVNSHLTCVFAQIPSTWQSDANYQAITMPGVDRSSLYAPTDFDFRGSPISISTQIRYEHAYFLGPISSIATRQRFRPVDADGVRVSVINDQTYPSANEYISMVNGRQELVMESIVLPWRGDIWDRRTLFALAK